MYSHLGRPLGYALVVHPASTAQGLLMYNGPIYTPPVQVASNMPGKIQTSSKKYSSSLETKK